jgi:predicted SAM-dependent methyltransferase
VSAKQAVKAGYLAESRLTRLNWGCGEHLAVGWINSDVKAEPGVDLIADVRRGLPLDSDSVDYAVSVHALPELAYPELVPALAELLRVIKPEGALRLVLPDFDRSIDAYRGGDAGYFKVPPEEARSIGARFLVHALWFGHSRSLFTRDFAEELLARAGFERIEACRFKRTASPFGRIVELDNREQESFYVEARKPRPEPGRAPLPYNLRVAGDELEIVDIAPDPGERLRGHFRVRKEDGRKIEIVGWVLGREAAATEVEVRAEGAVAGRAPVVIDRPDVAEKFPDVAEAGTAGFQLELKAEGRGGSQLEVWVVLADGSCEPLGRIVVKAARRGLLDAIRRG